MADPEPIDSVSALRRNPELQHLLQAIGLGEGFQFHILVCETPRIARAAISLLAEEAKGRLLHLDPYQGLDPREPLSFDRLSSVILAALCHADMSPDAKVVIIDVSHASQKDEPAWRELFQRLNERRNIIAGCVSGSLVLCVTPTLEVAFAHEAPDFWSIRSTAVRVSTRQNHEKLFDILDKLVAEGEQLSEQLVLMLPEWTVEEARRRLRASPEDPAALRALAIQLSRLGLYKMRRGALNSALAAYEQSQDLMQRLVDRKPTRAEWLHGMADTLMKIGDLQRDLGSRGQALSSYEESLRVMRRLVEREPNQAEWQRDLALSLERIGDIQKSLGALDRALSAYEESLALRRHLLEKDPDRPQWQRDFVIILERLGRLLEERRE